MSAGAAGAWPPPEADEAQPPAARNMTTAIASAAGLPVPFMPTSLPAYPHVPGRPQAETP